MLLSLSYLRQAFGLQLGAIELPVDSEYGQKEKIHFRHTVTRSRVALGNVKADSHLTDLAFKPIDDQPAMLKRQVQDESLLAQEESQKKKTKKKKKKGAKPEDSAEGATSNNLLSLPEAPTGGSDVSGFRERRPGGKATAHEHSQEATSARQQEAPQDPGYVHACVNKSTCTLKSISSVPQPYLSYDD